MHRPGVGHCVSFLGSVVNKRLYPLVFIIGVYLGLKLFAKFN